VGGPGSVSTFSRSCISLHFDVGGRMSVSLSALTVALTDCCRPEQLFIRQPSDHSPEEREQAAPALLPVVLSGTTLDQE
jgi:hypothetical protein